ncbi:MAG: hypothetical protein AAB223_08815, partial [Pseudomonadota bacterium]
EAYSAEAAASAAKAGCTPDGVTRVYSRRNFSSVSRASENHLGLRFRSMSIPAGENAQKIKNNA